MILGVYWYFGFPSGLYHFDYFRFKEGLGGHADSPAELVASVLADNSESLMEQLGSLVKRSRDASLCVCKDGNLLLISIGGYQLFDYEFLMAREVEKILASEGVQINLDKKLSDPQVFHLQNKQSEQVCSSTDYFQLVGSPLRKYNAETLALRLDCHLDANVQQAFLNDFDQVAGLAGIEVLYYFENGVADSTNLMLFLSNGRQGLHLQDKKLIDCKLLDAQTEALFRKYNVQKGHLGALGHYPQGKPIVRRMVDQELVLGA